MKRQIIITLVCILLILLVIACVFVPSIEFPAVYRIPPNLSPTIVSRTPQKFIEEGFHDSWPYMDDDGKLNFADIYVDLNKEEATIDKNGNLVLVLYDKHKREWLDYYGDFLLSCSNHGIMISSDFKEVTLNCYAETVWDAIWLCGHYMSYCPVNQLLNGTPASDISVKFVLKDALTGEIVSTALWPYETFNYNSGKHKLSSIHDLLGEDSN